MNYPNPTSVQNFSDSAYSASTADASNDWAIEAINVSHRFGVGRGQRIAFANVNLTVKKGEFISIVGPSGCGKSTLLNLIVGFQRPSTGQIIVDGKRVVGPGADRGMVFQKHCLFPWMSVRANIEFGPRMSGINQSERRKIADEILELVGLRDVAKNATYELSGGMQQRAAIERALANRPKVLLMDEPFSALDAFTRERLQDELISLWTRTNTSILFVTHSVDEAVYLGTRIVAMKAHPGEVILDVQVPRNNDQDRSRESYQKDLQLQSLKEQISISLRTTAFRTA